MPALQDDGLELRKLRRELVEAQLRGLVRYLMEAEGLSFADAVEVVQHGLSDTAYSMGREGVADGAL